MPDATDERDPDKDDELVKIEPGDIVRRNDDGSYSVVPRPPDDPSA